MAPPFRTTAPTGGPDSLRTVAVAVAPVDTLPARSTAQTRHA
ncbi:MAG: hypothetical protein ABMB14_17490 [Myxococcota bacterium]